MLVLFDLDDTLLDDRGATRSAAAFLHKRVGSPLALESFFAAWDSALAEHFPRYLAGELSFQQQRRQRLRHVIDASLLDDAADRLFEEYHERYEAGWALFPDAPACLLDLSHARVGVITNGNGAQQRLKLDRTGLAEKLDCIVISEECGFSKPDPRIFLHACASAGAKPEESVYVGDRYDIDALAARAAGLKGIWLDRHNRATACHLPPTINSLSELKVHLPIGASPRPVPSGR